MYYSKADFEKAIERSPEELTPRGMYADWLEDNGFALEASWQRFGGAMTRREFEAAVIAQHDDDDYSESGYVACVVDRGGKEYALLAQYGHCSCYGTWESICGGGISDYFEEDAVKYPTWTWIGSVDELIHAAENDLDLTTKGRKLHDNDSDVDHLREVYTQIRKWATANRASPPNLNAN